MATASVTIICLASIMAPALASTGYLFSPPRGQFHSVFKRQIPLADSSEQPLAGVALKNETEETKNATETHTFTDEEYYTVETIQANEDYLQSVWLDVDDLIETNKASGMAMHPQLRNSYRRAVATPLNFTFPFYGFPTHNVTIATGGFLYVGEHTHSWLAATQYIAPLMANFDTTTMDEATIAYADTKEQFVVEWRNVVIRKQEEAGNFTFQCILNKNGSIFFLYKEVPIEVKDIWDLHHPRKVGLSDAYMETENGQTLLFSKRIIYEYHRIEIGLDTVHTDTVIHIRPKKTCFSFTTCDECMKAKLDKFECTWCDSVSFVIGEPTRPFCSDLDGRHRLHEEYKRSRCGNKTDTMYCQTATPAAPASPAQAESTSPTTSTAAASSTDAVDRQDNTDVLVTKEEVVSGGGGSGGVIFLTLMVLIVLAAGGWLAYAYYNPHTTSGQLLIRYRPTRWNLGSSDVRYTASVHM